MGIGGDGLLLLSEPDSAASSPGCGSTPRWLGGRTLRERSARGDHVPPAPRLDGLQHLLDPDDRGRAAPDDHGDYTCTVDMGRARLTSPTTRAEARTASRELEASGLRWRFQHVKIGNPQCSIRVGSIDDLEALDLPAIGPSIEHHALFPNRTNVSWYTSWRRTASGLGSSSVAWGRRCRRAPARRVLRWRTWLAAATAPSRWNSTAASSR